jgi:hypothetical protein
MPVAAFGFSAGPNCQKARIEWPSICGGRPRANLAPGKRLWRESLKASIPSKPANPSR